MDKLTLLKLFELGGWSMWPLLIMSIVTVSVSIERLFYFLSQNFKIKDVEEKVLKMLEEGKIEETKKYLESLKNNRLIKPILLEGIKMVSLGEHRMEKAIESETIEKTKELERNLNFLVEMGSLAPITGFLGTVSGMIGAFNSIAKATDVNAQLVAGGIFEALITTAYGLIIAVVSIAMYNIYMNIVERFVSHTERVGTDFITTIVIASNKENSDE